MVRPTVTRATYLPPTQGPLPGSITPAVVSNVSNNLLNEPVSGLFGLAFQDIASSRATPLWQALVEQAGTLDAPVMAFHLTRFIHGSGSGPERIEPGGSCVVGAVNDTLFTGEIDYQPVDGSTGYWTLRIGCESQAQHLV